MDQPVLTEEYRVIEGFIPEPIRSNYSILPVAMEGEHLKVIVALQTLPDRI
jgi:hypothetical protein